MEVHDLVSHLKVETQLPPFLNRMALGNTKCLTYKKWSASRMLKKKLCWKPNTENTSSDIHLSMKIFHSSIAT